MLALAASASGALRWRVIGSQRGSGDYAIVDAIGTADHPTAVGVRVFATPNQAVEGAWHTECSKGLDTGKTKSGRLDGTTPFLRVLRMPMAHPDNCSVIVIGELSGSGSIHVQVLKR
jgi:hypothetical protein